MLFTFSIKSSFLSLFSFNIFLNGITAISVVDSKRGSFKPFQKYSGLISLFVRQTPHNLSASLNLNLIPFLVLTFFQNSLLFLLSSGPSISLRPHNVHLKALLPSCCLNVRVSFRCSRNRCISFAFSS